MSKPETQQRKQPRQQRARVTVEALLDATAQLLVAAGPAGVTTNRIAERAGVSIGSLYQYFPNKHALLRALLERHVQQAEALRPDELRGDTGIPLRARIRLAVEWHVAVHAADPALHDALASLAPDVLGARDLRAFERQVERTIRAALEAYRDEIRPPNLDMAAFFVGRCLESLTHGAVVHHPELLAERELADEMTELIAGYLEG